MKEHPVLFNTSMAKAILSGAKTVTRRPIKPQPPALMRETIGLDSEKMSDWIGESAIGEQWRARCPLGEQGRSTLWVRETCSISSHMDDGLKVNTVYYAADGVRHEGVKLTPSIHMPRWASRITLKVTSVSVERVSDITEADAIAEGIARNPAQDGTWIDYPEGTSVAGWRDPIQSFRSLWNTVYRDALSWDNGPWVWAVGFEVVGTKGVLLWAKTPRSPGLTIRSTWFSAAPKLARPASTATPRPSRTASASRSGARTPRARP